MKHISDIRASELHQTCTGVYAGTRELPIKEQRGRRYVNFKGKQINLKKIPSLEHQDVVFDYVFNGTFKTRPNKYLDMCVKMRTAQNQEKEFNQTKSSMGISESFHEFKKIAIQLQKDFKNEQNRD